MLTTISRAGVVNVWDVHSKLRKHLERRAQLPFFSFSTFQTAVLSATERESVEARGMVGVSEGLLLVLERRGVAVVGGVTLSVMRRLGVDEMTVGGEWSAGDEFISMQLASASPPCYQLVLTSLARVVLTVTLECRYERGGARMGSWRRPAWSPAPAMASSDSTTTGEGAWGRGERGGVYCCPRRLRPACTWWMSTSWWGMRGGSCLCMRC